MLESQRVEDQVQSEDICHALVPQQVEEVTWGFDILILIRHISVV
jgi:hypothetical protein